MNLSRGILTLMFIMLVGLGMTIGYNYYNSKKDKPYKTIPLSALVNYVESTYHVNPDVREIYVIDNDIYIFYKDQILHSKNHPGNSGFVKSAIEKGYKVTIRDPEVGVLTMFDKLLHFIFIILFIIMMIISIRMMTGSGGGSGGGGGIFQFGKKKMSSVNNTGVMFKDVAGVEEAKFEVEEIVEFLKDPKKFDEIGAKIPKGVLLFGPPGTGKTLLAKAIAGEAGVPFFSCSGSEFVEMFVGVGASRIRSLFDKARKSSPCIVFIDEIDAVAGKRDVGYSGGNDERNSTLNQLLTELDGFIPGSHVILIGATNRKDSLDPAILRPGRIDRQVVVSLPDKKAREKILNIYAKKIQLGDDVNLSEIARLTSGFSGADLASITNEAAIIAVANKRQNVLHKDYEAAREKQVMGKEHRSIFVSEKEKKITAYHEAGHAFVALVEEHTENPHKATIIPRVSGSLGHVYRMPSQDMQFMQTTDQLIAHIRVALAGRIAEEVFHDLLHSGTSKSNFTTGAYSDMQSAYNVAYSMVANYGMSDLGMSVFVSHEDVAYGRKVLSESEKDRIVVKVRELLNQQIEYVRDLIRSNKDKLDAIARMLLYCETADEAMILEAYKNGYSEPIQDSKSESLKGEDVSVDGSTEVEANEEDASKDADFGVDDKKDA